MTMAAGAKLVLLGRIAAAHGVRGDVLVKSFTAEPAAIAAYGACRMPRAAGASSCASCA